MTWEEIIIDIRKKPEYSQLVKDSYFGEDLIDCVERYRASDEFVEILQALRSINNKSNLRILDLGAGNGISSVAFALCGYEVIALEPDLSKTVGAGAIEFLQKHYQLPNLEIITCFAEDMPYPENSFDLVFARQSMHHAYNLESFVNKSSNVLKKGGVFFTIRDHVVNNREQKEAFLNQHPLHKFYGGENAYSLEEYKNAITHAGLKIISSIGPYDNSINYYPETFESMKNKFQSKFLFSLNLPNIIFKFILVLRRLLTNNYNQSPGRLFSFIAIKK